jgi:hypothetical protein
VVALAITSTVKVVAGGADATFEVDGLKLIEPTGAACAAAGSAGAAIGIAVPASRAAARRRRFARAIG